MKNLFSLSLVLSLLALSCRDNAANNDQHRKDSTDRTGGYSPDTSTSRDTSSYQRMPNKVNDTLRQ